MRGVGGLGQVAARDLVFALCAGLDALQTALDCEVDSLIVADLEVEERVMLDRTPVAAEQRVRSDKIDCARDPFFVALCHHQQHVVGHGIADLRKELAREVRSPPFARAGLHIEFKESIPRIWRDVGASECINSNTIRQRITALATDRLAMA